MPIEAQLFIIICSRLKRMGGGRFMDTLYMDSSDKTTLNLTFEEPIVYIVITYS